MKRIDQLTIALLDSYIAHGTWGNGSIFVDSDGYAYFHSEYFGKITVKYRKSHKVSRLNKYQKRFQIYYEYWTTFNPTLAMKLYNEIKKRVRSEGYRWETRQAIKEFLTN
jgi:hypothetical protein